MPNSHHIYCIPFNQHNAQQQQIDTRVLSAVVTIKKMSKKYANIRRFTLQLIVMTRVYLR
jgi:hypothetical protein